MAIFAYKDVSITINSVDLSDRSAGCVLTYEIEAQDATVFGDKVDEKGRTLLQRFEAVFSKDEDAQAILDDLVRSDDADAT